MEKILLVVVGLSCLLSSGLVLFKVASRDGEPVYPWLEKDGARSQKLALDRSSRTSDGFSHPLSCSLPGSGARHQE